MNINNTSTEENYAPWEATRLLPARFVLCEEKGQVSAELKSEIEFFVYKWARPTFVATRSEISWSAHRISRAIYATLAFLGFCVRRINLCRVVVDCTLGYFSDGQVLGPASISLSQVLFCRYGRRTLVSGDELLQKATSLSRAYYAGLALFPERDPEGEDEGDEEEDGERVYRRIRDELPAGPLYCFSIVEEDKNLRHFRSRQLSELLFAFAVELGTVFGMSAESVAYIVNTLRGPVFAAACMYAKSVRVPAEGADVADDALRGVLDAFSRRESIKKSPVGTCHGQRRSRRGAGEEGEGREQERNCVPAANAGVGRGYRDVGYFSDSRTVFQVMSCDEYAGSSSLLHASLFYTLFRSRAPAPTAAETPREIRAKDMAMYARHAELLPFFLQQPYFLHRLDAMYTCYRQLPGSFQATLHSPFFFHVNILSAFKHLRVQLACANQAEQALHPKEAGLRVDYLDCYRAVQSMWRDFEAAGRTAWLCSGPELSEDRTDLEARDDWYLTVLRHVAAVFFIVLPQPRASVFQQLEFGKSLVKKKFRVLVRDRPRRVELYSIRLGDLFSYACYHKMFWNYYERGSWAPLFSPLTLLQPRLTSYHKRGDELHQYPAGIKPPEEAFQFSSPQEFSIFEASNFFLTRCLDHIRSYNARVLGTNAVFSNRVSFSEKNGTFPKRAAAGLLSPGASEGPRERETASLRDILPRTSPFSRSATLYLTTTADRGLRKGLLTELEASLKFMSAEDLELLFLPRLEDFFSFSKNTGSEPLPRRGTGLRLFHFRKLAESFYRQVLVASGETFTKSRACLQHTAGPFVSAGASRLGKKMKQTSAFSVQHSKDTADVSYGGVVLSNQARSLCGFAYSQVQNRHLHAHAVFSHYREPWTEWGRYRSQAEDRGLFLKGPAFYTDNDAAPRRRRRRSAAAAAGASFQKYRLAFFLTQLGPRGRKTPYNIALPELLHSQRLGRPRHVLVTTMMLELPWFLAMLPSLWEQSDSLTRARVPKTQIHVFYRLCRVGNVELDRDAVRRTAEEYQAATGAPIDFYFSAMTERQRMQHSKTFFIFHEHGLRVVVSSANLMSYEWSSYSQTCWLQDFRVGQSPTDLRPAGVENGFRAAITKFLAAFADLRRRGAGSGSSVDSMLQLLERIDFTPAEATLVHNFQSNLPAAAAVVAQAQNSARRSVRSSIYIQCSSITGFRSAAEATAAVGRLRARAGDSAATIGSSSPQIHILWHRAQTIRTIVGRGAKMFFLSHKLRALLLAEPRVLFEQWNSRNEEGQGQRQTILPHGKIFLETLDVATTPSAARIRWVLTGSYNFSKKALGAVAAGANIEAGIMYNNGPIYNYFVEHENLDPRAVYCPLPFDIETLERFGSASDIFISA